MNRGAASVPPAMALQCPTCRHTHPMDGRTPGERFRCRGCGRLLSVPASAAADPAAGPGGNGGAATAAVPRVGRGPRAAPPVPPRAPAHAPATAVLAPRAPTWLRVAVWVVAIPLGFLVAAVPLRAAGVLDVDYVIAAFADEDLGRFAVLLVVLPVWAALSATLAHVTLERAARRRPGRAPGSGPGVSG